MSTATSSDSSSSRNISSSSPTRKVKISSRKRKADIENSADLEEAILQYIKESKIKQKIAIDQSNNPSALLFNQYAIRLEKLPKEVQNFVQLQISQIFFNAENPNFFTGSYRSSSKTKIFPSTFSTSIFPPRKRPYQPLQIQNSTSAPEDILSKLCSLENIF